MTFVSCNEETLYDGPCKVRFVAEVQDEVSVTRATTPGYTKLTPSEDFNAGLYVSYGATAQPYTMSWDDNSKLSANLWLETGDYKFYGYAPASQQDGASFDNSNKILTISNVSGLSSTDLLVIKPCSKEIATSDISSGTKNVSLQMDHLMAKITPQFYINSDYNQLRDIRIKEVELFFESAPTYTATVTYTNTSYSVAWPSSDTSAKTTLTAFSTTNPTNLTNAATAHGHCYIVPDQDITNLKMTVKYDVYDKKRQLVRQDATATNKVVVKVNSTTKTKLEAGKNYKLKIQIIPTYLYVLSDNDESSVLVIPNN